MKHSYYLLRAFFLVAFLVIQNTGAQAQQTRKDIPIIERNKMDGTAKSVTFPGTALPKKAALKQLFSKYLNIDGRSHTLVLKNSTNTRQKTTIDRYSQFLNGIKVEFAEYSVISKGDEVSFMTGNIYNPGLIFPSNPHLQLSQCLEKALAVTGAKKYMWEEADMEQLLKKETGNPDTSYFPKGNLVWVEDLMGEYPDRQLHLAYAFNIYALQPLSREMVYADANTGKILCRNPLLTSTSCSGTSLYSGTVHFQAAHAGTAYSLHDSTRGGGINTYTNANGTGSISYEVTSVSPAWTTDASLDAHWGAEKVFDYWHDVQGRNSINNAGMPVNSYTHLLTGYDNAYWDGSHMVYGDGSGIGTGGFSPLVALDVCAHEIGHGICQYTAGLIYAKESGAMNEGFSDIWGAIIENYADPHETDAVAKNMWTIGEEVSAGGLRRIDNPNIKGQPDTYTGTFWTSLPGCIPNVTNDYCGVHNNSGVLNYWFYLLCHGGSGTNDIGHAFSVTGIGTTEGANIVYQTELMLSPNATFLDCRTASINVAATLYGTCAPEVQAVAKAWYAVGVGPAYAFEIAAISGSAQVCTGSSTALTDVGTGTWTSSNLTAASINSATGIVSGIAAGTTVITYTVGSGCITTIVVTVNSTPSAITGTTALCASAAGTLNAVPTGGTWSSGNPSIAMIGSGSGILTGTGSGSTVITYSIANGCYHTAVVTVNSVVSITGPSAVCPAATITLANATPGGTWSSSNISVASIGAAGAVTGMTPGTTMISYAYTGSCGAAITTKLVTVNPIPGAGSITGPSALCEGFSVTFSNAVTGGVWSNSDINKLVIIAGGLATGIKAGVDTIKYTYSNSCGAATTQKTVTVNATLMPDIVVNVAGNGIQSYTGDGGPATAAGIGGVSDIVFDHSGNMYFSSDVSSVIRKVTPSGIITTIAGTGEAGFGGDGGLAIYAKFNATHAMAIDDAGNLYISDVLNARIRKINTLGIISTFAGTGTPGYTGDGGAATMARIYGSSGIVTDNSGNIYFSNANYVRKINPAGVISTIAGMFTYGWSGDGGPATDAHLDLPWKMKFDAAGNMYVSDEQNNRIRKITPSGIISTIAGLGGSLIAGDGGPASSAQVMLPIGIDFDASGNIYIAQYDRIRKIDNTTGIITTIAGGNGFEYNGDSMQVSVVQLNNVQTVKIGLDGHLYLGEYNRIRKIVPDPPVARVSGNLTVCTNISTPLRCNIPGGTWSSNNTAVAIVNASSGSVFGQAPGTAVISYALSNSCGSILATAIVTVNPSPATITGSSNICVGATTTLFDATPGGIWKSQVPSIASIDSASGIVTGVSVNYEVISYILPTGCFRTFTIAVAGSPDAGIISGSGNICVGAVTPLSGTVAGGTWSSSPAGIVTVSPPGNVTGIAPGTATISYLANNGCGPATATRIVTVTNLPDAGAITGVGNLCIGAATTLSNTIPGGSWSSAAPGIAIVGSSGTVSGIAAGTTTISYKVTNSCGISAATRIVTVNVLPDAGSISGASGVCVANTTLLNDPAPGGVWTSASTGIATIGTSGAVTGILPGTSTISYTVTNSCGAATATKTVTVQAIPDAGTITGSTVAICPSTVVLLGDAVGGGAWSSAAPGIASISATGSVTGISGGTSTISYTVNNGCGSAIATKVVTVQNTPDAGVITGPATLCVAATSTLGNTSPGGTWSTAPLGAASVNISGTITGISAGTSIITYSTANACGIASTTKVVTVIPIPAAGTITGTATLCAASTTALSNTAPGGAWSSALTGVATVGSTGIVTGISAGTSTIYYIVGNGCGIASTIKNVTVNPLPNAGTITGADTVCVADTIHLSDAAPGGVWSSMSPGIAIVGASGAVTGVLAGTSTISYAQSNSCGTATATKTIFINPLPATITGTMQVCMGLASTLADASPGGSWSSGNTVVAPVGAASGIVTGIAPGTTLITYNLPTGCNLTGIVTVNPVPVADTVTGGGNYCAGGSGVHIFLNGSATGTTYHLYDSTSLVGSLSGTGLPLDFGLHSGAGTYSVIAVNTASCTNNMQGTVLITVIPTFNPMVAITTSSNDTVCKGVTVLYTANPTNGGTLPVYQWRVNGISMSAGNSFSYAPVDGDLVSVKLTSNLPCPVPDSAIASKAMTVMQNEVPKATITVNHDSVCLGASVIFDAISVYGGTVPLYTWMQNGNSVATGSSYAYIPANGDMVYASLHSDYGCLAANDVSSNAITIQVDSIYKPVVSLTVDPDTASKSGQLITFTAHISSAGAAPVLQWMKNGIAITGATSSVYSSSSLKDSDVVTCRVWGTGECADSNSGFVVVHIAADALPGPVGNLQLMPNPSTGSLTLSGSLGTTADETVTVKIMDMLGQEIYANDFVARGGIVNAQIQINKGAANSVYLLNAIYGKERKVFKVVLKR